MREGRDRGGRVHHVTNAVVVALLGHGEQAPRTVKECLCGSFINERSAREDGWRPH